MPRPVFLAAPERGAGALGLIDKVILELQFATGGALRGTHVYVPHLQAGDVGVETDAATWFSRVLEGLSESRVVVAVLDGPQVDEQVAFLVGAAFAARKPVIGYATDGRGKGALVEGALSEIVSDPKGLATALAKVLL